MMHHLESRRRIWVNTWRTVYVLGLLALDIILYKGRLEMKAYKLRKLRHIMPEVFRVVLVPAGITFMRLHDVIQFAMGWQLDTVWDK